MKSKILTVSVSAYNVENYIDEALSKFLVLGDMLNDIEILIIDDGGTDRTKDIALMYAQKYPETYKFIHKQNGGWGSTVNTGIRLASGKYFKQLDGDDYFL
jgi:glycosyltransferase involved in cell wall biosynthesis